MNFQKKPAVQILKALRENGIDVLTALDKELEQPLEFDFDESAADCELSGVPSLLKSMASDYFDSAPFVGAEYQTYKKKPLLVIDTETVRFELLFDLKNTTIEMQQLDLEVEEVVEKPKTVKNGKKPKTVVPDDEDEFDEDLTISEEFFDEAFEEEETPEPKQKRGGKQLIPAKKSGAKNVSSASALPALNGDHMRTMLESNVKLMMIQMLEMQIATLQAARDSIE